MITFKKLGNKGNLGNQLFQIASTIGIANRNNQNFGFGDWGYQPFFKNSLPKIDFSDFDFKNILEKEYKWHNWKIAKDIDYSLEGWLQTEKYFDVKSVKYYFEFSSLATDKVEKLYKKAFEKSTILISIRRGDFVRHPDYYQTPIKYFLNALDKYFDNWLEQNLIILSDDINYCKYHFSFLPNVYFGDGLSAIEQLYLGSKCQHFIISNSTFSWWSAWLGESESSIVVAPFQNFRGDKRIESNDKDFYPSRWVKYNFETDKIQLKNLNIEYIDRIPLKQAMINYYFYLNDSEDIKQKLFLKPNYIVSPIFIYYCSILHSNLNIYTLYNIKYVSSIFDQKEFIMDYDFGFFSSIMRLSENKKRMKVGEFAVESSSNSEIEDVYIIVGCFKKFGGLKFQFLMWKRTTKKIIKIQLKRLIK